MKTLKEIILEKTILQEGTADLVPGKKVKAKDLKAGNKYMYFYRNGGRTMSDMFIFRGFSNAETQYGKSGPVFSSLKEVMKNYGVTNAKDLENIDEKLGLEYGFHVYMCASFEGMADGCYFYLNNGRWSRGSGADAMTMYEAVPPEKE